ncbi:MAG: hypothetical protein U1D30_00385 [Planctomycetota bacterium]
MSYRSGGGNGKRWMIATSAALLLGGCAPVADSPAPSASEVAKSAEVVAVKPQTPLPASLKTRLEAAIEQVRQRELYTNNAFWTIFHGILGLGPGLAITDPNTQTKVNALDYVFGGNFAYGEIRGMRFIPTSAGLDVQTGPTFIGQGHQDQFIAEIAQWNTPPDKKVIVYGREYTLMDFVHEVKAHVRPTGQELSWAIVVLAQYIGTDFEWTNRFGEKLHYNDVVRFELEASVNQAACGGTHRLFGLTWAYHLHMQNGGKKEGIWKEVADKLDQHVAMAKEYQNPDGAFSSLYFRGKGSTTDPKDRLGAAGHTLEWLAAWLPDDQLKEQWMQDGANAVSLMILDLQSAEMESGALYHAVHGLILYYRRVFGWEKFDSQLQPTLAEQNSGFSQPTKTEVPAPPPDSSEPAAAKADEPATDPTPKSPPAESPTSKTGDSQAGKNAVTPVSANSPPTTPK